MKKTQDLKKDGGNERKIEFQYILDYNIVTSLVLIILSSISEKNDIFLIFI